MLCRTPRQWIARSQCGNCAILSLLSCRGDHRRHPTAGIAIAVACGSGAIMAA